MIHIKNLCFAYKLQNIYQQLNAEINTSGIYGLFGRNGSGKSTLLKLMSGLLTPDDGNIQILGFQPRKRQPDFLNQIYILPEEFHLPDLTSAKLAQIQAPFYPKFSLALYNEYIDTFEIPITKRFSKMSLGQKKKVTIALALATLTPILLMDEPTNGLDIVSRSLFKEFMLRPEQQERVVLISTHQAHDLENIIDNIWFIDNGKVLLSASIGEINQALKMGVSDTLTVDEVIYHEKIGQQYFWVAKNRSSVSTNINVEMLYKALSINQADIVEAIYSIQAKGQLC